MLPQLAEALLQSLEVMGSVVKGVALEINWSKWKTQRPIGSPDALAAGSKFQVAEALTYVGSQPVPSDSSELQINAEFLSPGIGEDDVDGVVEKDIAEQNAGLHRTYRKKVHVVKTGIQRP